VSNTLGSSMVLQRAPATAMIWGSALPATTVTIAVSGWAGDIVLTAATDTAGLWRIQLPPTEASSQPTSLTVSSDRADDIPVELLDLLFGDVYVCSGQSNMEYSVSGGWIWGGKAAGDHTWRTELATINYPTIRGIHVGKGTDCSIVDCGSSFPELNTIQQPWSVLDEEAVRVMPAACYYFATELQDKLGSHAVVPLGLVSASWGGSTIQRWRVYGANTSYYSGDLFNSMLAPFTVGPMPLAGFLWYQGEGNSGEPEYYYDAQKEMVLEWRSAFEVPDAWFGFVQLSDFVSDWGAIRQAQLGALALPHVGMSTAIDLGTYYNLHPVDKWNIGYRLAHQALVGVYARPSMHAFFPMYAGARVMDLRDGLIRIAISLTTNGLLSEAILAGKGTDPAPLRERLTLTMPLKEHLLYGKMLSNKCPMVDSKCGWPTIYGRTADGVECALTLRHEDLTDPEAVGAAAIGGLRENELIFTARAPTGFTVTATSYGYAAHARTVFFTMQTDSGSGGLPVLPWYAPIETTNLLDAPMPGVADLPAPCAA